MFRYLLTGLLICLGTSLWAQGKDSLFVRQSGNGWAIIHVVKQGETIFSLSRRYHVPPAILTDANWLSYQQVLVAKQELKIPLGAYNQMNGKPVNENEMRPLYLEVGSNPDLYRIARNSNVQQKTIQQWNNMESTDLYEGQRLIVGWVLYDATPMPGEANSSPISQERAQEIKMTSPEPAKKTVVVNGEPVNIPSKIVTPPRPFTPAPKQPVVTAPEKKPEVVATVPDKNKTTRPVTIYVMDGDTIRDEGVAPIDTLSEAEELYISQTHEGQNVHEEKGPAVFYPSASRSKQDIYYAFHNTAPRGTIIKVHNPGTDKTIFVKVIGTLPGTKLYHNSLIGITSQAKQELGVRNEEKAWCELSYAGF
jgi:LysM repeat protein